MHIISTFVQGAVREVFSTMASMEVTALDADNDQATLPILYRGMLGSVSFTGKMNGVLYLNLSEKLAVKVTAFIMGSDDLSGISNDSVNDVVGELTNMVTGNLKSKMCDQGYNCKLSVPSVIRGEELSIDSPGQDLALNGKFAIPAIDEQVQVCVFAQLEVKGA